MGVIWETTIVDFLLVTVFLGGAAAYLTGRAMASVWRPLPLLVFYILLLNAAVRFIHYSLFGGTLLSLHYYLVDLVILLILAGLGFRLTRSAQMAGQYRWLYQRAGLLWWRRRPAAENEAP
jgi:Domain of unknown function (DUF6867)